jgi:uncharacterized membrane protein
MSRLVQTVRIFCLFLVLSFCGGAVYAAADIRQVVEIKKAQTFVFHCDDASTFVAQVEGESAWLFLPSETLELPQIAPDTFQTGELLFQLDGETCLLEKSNGKSRRCKNNRREAIWEHAKLQGADFRAIGNEPGWHLEIYEESKAILVTGYGSKKYEFDLLPPQIDRESRTTVFTSTTDKPRIILKIMGERCSDSMSGEQFESRVEVDLAGDVLRGCGRALH